MPNPSLIPLYKELHFLALAGGGMEIKSVEGFRLNIRAAVRAFWLDITNYDEFLADMTAAINRGFRQAWQEGMQSFGLKLEDMSAVERAALRFQISQESSYLEGFASFVEQNRKSEGGKLSMVNDRADLWVKAYHRITELAKTYAGQDRPACWTMGVSEHCQSCQRLSGKVKRFSFWQSHGVYPGSWDKLDCKLGCHCSLVATTEPLSPGPLPKLP